MRNNIGRLSYLRGLTDRELATGSGVSRAHLNRIRNGHAIPRVDTAIAVARALGCSVADLFVLPLSDP